MLVLAGSPLLFGSLSTLAVILSVVAIGLVLHRTRTIVILTPEQQLARLTQKLRHKWQYRAQMLREWF